MLDLNLSVDHLDPTTMRGQLNTEIGMLMFHPILFCSNIVVQNSSFI